MSTHSVRGRKENRKASCILKQAEVSIEYKNNPGQRESADGPDVARLAIEGGEIFEEEKTWTKRLVRNIYTVMRSTNSPNAAAVTSCKV